MLNSDRERRDHGKANMTRRMSDRIFSRRSLASAAAPPPRDPDDEEDEEEEDDGDDDDDREPAVIREPDED